MNFGLDAFFLRFAVYYIVGKIKKFVEYFCCGLLVFWSNFCFFVVVAIIVDPCDFSVAVDDL